MFPEYLNQQYPTQFMIYDKKISASVLEWQCWNAVKSSMFDDKIADA